MGGEAAITLNFRPSFAARIIRSKSALAIKFVTTSPVLVAEMLKMYIRDVINVGLYQMTYKNWFSID